MGSARGRAGGPTDGGMTGTGPGTGRRGEWSLWLTPGSYLGYCGESGGGGGECTCCGCSYCSKTRLGGCVDTLATLPCLRTKNKTIKNSNIRERKDHG